VELLCERAGGFLQQASCQVVPLDVAAHDVARAIELRQLAVGSCVDSAPRFSLTSRPVRALRPCGLYGALSRRQGEQAWGGTSRPCDTEYRVLHDGMHTITVIETAAAGGVHHQRFRRKCLGTVNHAGWRLKPGSVIERRLASFAIRSPCADGRVVGNRGRGTRLVVERNAGWAKALGWASTHMCTPTASRSRDSTCVFRRARASSSKRVRARWRL
jgi:hypothetical protein